MILNRTKHRPTIGVICGSGLSALGDIVEEKYDIPYEQIKQFPKSTGKFVMFCQEKVDLGESNDNYKKTVQFTGIDMFWVRLRLIKPEPLGED